MARASAGHAGSKESVSAGYAGKVASDGRVENVGGERGVGGGVWDVGRASEACEERSAGKDLVCSSARVALGEQSKAVSREQAVIREREREVQSDPTRDGITQPNADEQERLVCDLALVVRAVDF